MGSRPARAGIHAAEAAALILLDTNAALWLQAGHRRARPLLGQSGLYISPVSLLELQSGNPERNIALRAGDTVYFPRAAQVYVMGSVARPGPYRYQEGMTVLQVLTLAGGVTERGSQGRTKVVRVVDGKKVEKKVKATDLVLPEDTLVVPERFF